MNELELRLLTVFRRASASLFSLFASRTPQHQAPSDAPFVPTPAGWEEDAATVAHERHERQPAGDRKQRLFEHGIDPAELSDNEIEEIADSL